MGSDGEEAARVAGASPLRVMVSVSLPMVRPAMLYASVLLFFLGLSALMVTHDQNEALAISDRIL